MKESPSALKSFLDKVGATLFSCNYPISYKRQTQKFEKKLAEAIRRRAAPRQKSFKSVDSIIMRFPHFKEGLRTIKDVFQQYDEDLNGTIDHEELKKCLSELELHLPEKEINTLYHYCDIDGKEGIQYNEFIVLLCLAYLLMEPSTATHNISKIGLPKVEAVFDTLVEAFSFLDKNGDGKLRSKDMVLALNEASPWEKSPTHITMKRFEEMDSNKDGKVNLKEFLFAFTKWIGLDSDDEVESQ